MTSDVVVDSCVIAKWLFKEVDSEIADRLFKDVIERGDSPHALGIALVEVANVIWKKQQKGSTNAADALRQLQQLEKIPLCIEPAADLLADALEIAVKYRRAVCDTLFVTLASQLEVTGVTADEPLYHAVHADFPNIILLRQWGLAPSR